jgi:hypothetical protein
MTDRPAKTASPLVAMDRAQIVRLLGPMMQRYVVGKL